MLNDPDTLRQMAQVMSNPVRAVRLPTSVLLAVLRPCKCAHCTAPLSAEQRVARQIQGMNIRSAFQVSHSSHFH